MKKLIILMVLIFLSMGGVNAVDENTDLNGKIEKYYSEFIEINKKINKDKTMAYQYLIDQIYIQPNYIFDENDPSKNNYSTGELYKTRIVADMTNWGGMCNIPSQKGDLTMTYKFGELHKQFTKVYLRILEKSLNDDGLLTNEYKEKIDKFGSLVEDDAFNTKHSGKDGSWYRMNGLRPCTAVRTAMRQGNLDNMVIMLADGYSLKNLVNEFQQSQTPDNGNFYSNTMNGNILVLSNKQKITKKLSDYTATIINIMNSKGNQVDRFFLFPFDNILNHPLNVGILPISLDNNATSEGAFDIGSILNIKEKLKMYQAEINESMSEINGKFSIVKIQGKYFLLARKVDVK